MSMDDIIVRTAKLTKNYRGRPALNELDLELRNGRIIGLVGPNGSGKTTLLKILAGVLADYSGTAEVLGLRPGLETKAQVSYMPDCSYLEDRMTPNDALDLFADFYTDFDRRRAYEMLLAFRLEPTQRLRDMSKGMREKVQITLVMNRAARLYLLDEPISGVDPASRQLILDSILRSYSSESCLVISTHLIHDIEPALDEVVFLDRGRVRWPGTPRICGPRAAAASISCFARSFSRRPPGSGSLGRRPRGPVSSVAAEGSRDFAWKGTLYVLSGSQI